MTICGDFGGRKDDGTPCGRRVTKSPCAAHGELGAAQLERQKAKFLEHYAAGRLSIKEAARKVGVAENTIWRWRQGDHAFGVAVAELLASVDDIRVSIVEDTLFRRVSTDRGSPAERIFYLVNRSKGRWRHVQHIQLSGEGGGPVLHDVHDLRKLSEEELFGRRDVALERALAVSSGAAAEAPVTNGKPKANGNGKHR